MSLRKLQEDIATWSSYNFGPDVTTMQSIVGLPEEVGELCRAVLKKYQGIRGTAEEWDAEIEKEIGDVLIKLCEFANRAGVDIEDAVFKRWAVVGMRNFVDNPIAHGLPSESELKMVYKRSKVMEAYLEMRKAYLKPFNLYRHEDVSGVSGNGVIAYGVEFPDGTVVMRWIGKYPTTVMHDKGIESIKAIHGHDGKTEVIWTEAAK